MHFTAYSTILDALSWAIVQSTWKIAAIWLLYKLLVISLGPKHIRAKYIAGCSSLCLSFVLFIWSIFQYMLTPDIVHESRIIGFATSLDVSLISPYLAGIYLFFLSCGIYKFYQNYKYVSYLKQQKFNKPPYEFKLFVEHYKNLLQLKKNVSLWVSDIIDSPITIGYFKPIILLPVAMLNQVSVRQMETIILHELSHIKKYDYLINFICASIETLLFFHPFARLIAKDIRIHREYLADDFVLQFKYSPNDYALALLEAEKSRIKWYQNKLFQAASGLSNKVLLQRISRFSSSPKPPKQPFLLLFQIGLSLVFLLFIALQQPNKTKIYHKNSAIESITLAGNISHNASMTLENPANDSSNYQISSNNTHKYGVKNADANQSQFATSDVRFNENNESKGSIGNIDTEDASNSVTNGQEQRNIFFLTAFPMQRTEEDSNHTNNPLHSKTVAFSNVVDSNAVVEGYIHLVGSMNLKLNVDSIAFVVIDRNDGSSQQILEVGPIDSILLHINWENVLHNYSIGKDMVKLIEGEILGRIVDQQILKFTNPVNAINNHTPITNKTAAILDSINMKNAPSTPILADSLSHKNRIIIKL